MAPNLSDLIAQQAALEREIEILKSTQKTDAVAKVRALMSEHGLTVADLAVATKGKQGIRAGTKVKPKYRDPASAQTWTGRGLKPKWLSAAIAAGKTVEDFLIA